MTVAPVYLMLWVTSFTPDSHVTSQMIFVPFADEHSCEVARSLTLESKSHTIGKASGVGMCVMPSLTQKDGEAGALLFENDTRPWIGVPHD